MRLSTAATTGLLAISVTGALLTGTAGAAEQGSKATCLYPYVCVIKNNNIIGQFQDLTGGWQFLPSKPAAPLTVVNTRNSAVSIRWTTGTTACLPPSSTIGFITGQLDAVRISSSTTC
ncbi:hypothetical protein ACFRR7_18125 [Streptomyces sp. NPDC056909]|uniref:hypothetical protein n=1 Tax=Streptomyces sp. NPDC056909 TaxID=3345963 RepID=UPI0036776645